MTGALLAGGIFGLGGYLLFRALFPSRPGIAARLAALDKLRQQTVRETSSTGPNGAGEHERRARANRRVGGALAQFYAARGWELRSVRADLALTGTSLESFLATKFLLGAGGLILVPLFGAYIVYLGIGISIAVPLWAGLILALLFFMLPDLQLKQDAAARRRDFRHAVGSFLDLVSMNLAGGRGVPEALTAASKVGDGWAIRRIAESLSNARITGRTPWQALGDLGDEVNVGELKDLSSALALVADDGAKIRQSLAARAVSMRNRELADLEGSAGERSQSMLIAQLLLCTGFLIFLAYPAMMRVMAT